MLGHSVLAAHVWKGVEEIFQDVPKLMFHVIEREREREREKERERVNVIEVSSQLPIDNNVFDLT